MSRRGSAHGETFEAALQQALAHALEVDAERVQLQLRVPGLDEVQGPVTLELDVDAGQAGGAEPDEGDATPAEGAVAETVRQHAGGDGDGERDGVAKLDESTEDDGEPVGSSGEAEVTIEELEEEADATADFLEGLLDALDLPGDLRIKVHDDHVEVEIVEVGSGALIGRRGQTLEAIQELVRCTLQRRFERRARVKVDVEGYRARRLEKLLDKAEEAIDSVLASGEPERLEPMDVFERKAVHQLVAGVDGLTSRSQGREPARRVVIEPE